MKKHAVTVFCLLLVLLSSSASACGPVILIPDSNTRVLFKQEIEGYSYDELGFILNEILARHGYHFDRDGKYYHYFSQITVTDENGAYTSFYHEADETVTNDTIYAGLSEVEYQNIHMIKEARAKKLEQGEKPSDSFYISVCRGDVFYEHIGDPYDILMPQHLTLPVYSGPGKQYLRGADGRAAADTTEPISAYGWDGDWLMITYPISSARPAEQFRVGYVHKDSFRKEFDLPHLGFDNRIMMLTKDACITDNPETAQQKLMALKAGDSVTVLRVFQKGSAEWAYVEANGKTPARGFIQFSLLQ